MCLLDILRSLFIQRSSAASLWPWQASPRVQSLFCLSRHTVHNEHVVVSSRRRSHSPHCALTSVSKQTTVCCLYQTPRLWNAWVCLSVCRICLLEFAESGWILSRFIVVRKRVDKVFKVIRSIGYGTRSTFILTGSYRIARKCWAAGWAWAALECKNLLTLKWYCSAQEV